MAHGITIRRRPQTERQAFLRWFVAACVKTGWSRSVAKAQARVAWDVKEPRAMAQFKAATMKASA